MRPEIQRHEWIKMQLRLAGSSLAQVARELGVRTSTVAAVSRGKNRSRRIEDRIATVLAIPAERLWPDRYAGDNAGPAAPDPHIPGGALSQPRA